MTLGRSTRLPVALWSRIENANISGGEPTTRNDLVDIARLMLDRFPRLRKLG
jgi:molybdenum cofactor biosynthesis enzyme MoaA